MANKAVVSVKTLTSHFSSLSQTEEIPRHHDRKPSTKLKSNTSYICKVKAVRIGDVETLMTGAIDFLISQGSTLGFFNEEDLFKYPKAGLRRKCFFTKMFAREVTLNDWNPAELVAAQYDLKQLNFSQLLFLWKLAASSGRTSKNLHSESCNCEHIAFKDAVQSIVFERLHVELLSPKRRCKQLLLMTRPPPDMVHRHESGSATCRPRRNSVSDDPFDQKNHPCDDTSWPLANASAAERKNLGREILVVLGLIRRLVSLTICPEPEGWWWRVFVYKPPPGHSTAIIHQPVEEYLPQKKLRPAKAVTKEKPTDDEHHENYLTRARCALRPVNRPPKPEAPRMDKPPRLPGAPPAKAKVSQARETRTGSWRRGVSLYQMPASHVPAGIELFLHFPTLQVSAHRPPGQSIYSYVQQPGMASLLTAATGGALSSSTVWDVIRFLPDAPTLNSQNLADTLNACVSELREVLKDWKRPETADAVTQRSFFRQSPSRSPTKPSQLRSEPIPETEESSDASPPRPLRKRTEPPRPRSGAFDAVQKLPPVMTRKIARRATHSPVSTTRRVALVTAVELAPVDEKRSLRGSTFDLGLDTRKSGIDALLKNVRRPAGRRRTDASRPEPIATSAPQPPKILSGVAAHPEPTASSSRRR